MGNFIGAKPSSVEMSYSHLAKEEDTEAEETVPTPKSLITTQEYAEFLLPYFWPAKCISSRIRCISTGVMVSLSKVCNVCAPLFLSRATNALVKGHYSTSNADIFFYCVLKFMSTFFKGNLD